ncbi:MAG: hypothetical protein ABI850_16745, partial [Flavobacterium sp.]
PDLQLLFKEAIKMVKAIILYLKFIDIVYFFISFLIVLSFRQTGRIQIVAFLAEISPSSK